MTLNQLEVTWSLFCFIGGALLFVYGSRVSRACPAYQSNNFLKMLTVGVGSLEFACIERSNNKCATIHTKLRKGIKNNVNLNILEIIVSSETPAMKICTWHR